MKLKNFLLDLLFPIQCLGCNKPGEWLCQNCLEKIKINSFAKFLKEDIWVATDYNQALIKKILYSYKYNFVTNLGEKLGDLLVAFLKAGSKDLNFDLVIPVPLAKKRIIWRGFNQAEPLARKISQEFGWRVGADLIKRIHYTHPQVGLSAEERKINVKGIFKLTDQRLVKGKKILLIDDVLTTGATIGECVKVLKQAGAKKVLGLVVAKG